MEDQVAVDMSYKAPTYGNFRKPQSAGLGSLTAVGTVFLFGAAIAVVLSIAVAGLLGGLVTGLVAAFVLLLLMVRDRHGRSTLQRITARLLYLRAATGGTNLYRSGPTGRALWGTHQLPGLAAASQLSEWRDSYARPFALLHVPSTGHFTVVLSAEPDGASLVDDEQVDQWVALWGQWLATMGHEPGLVAASVTVETAPDSGSRLRQEINMTLDDQAPLVALEALREIQESYPLASATIRASIALTFSAASRAGARRRSAEEMGRDLASRLPGLTQTLSATGAGAARPMSAQELCELVRVAYDPAAATLLDEAHARGEDVPLTWPEVGPSAHQATWDTYRHEGAVSVSWQMSSAPRGEVFSSVLAQLLAPHGDIDRKRVTLLYRPLDPAKAARIVEADKRNSDFRASSSARPSARALVEQRSATAAANDEARGAGLVNFGRVVTATVADESRLPDAEAAIDMLAASARIFLRRAYGSQDSAFVSALPLGLVLPLHLAVPSALREVI
jgi:hypothetical protein